MNQVNYTKGLLSLSVGNDFRTTNPSLSATEAYYLEVNFGLEH